MQSEHTIARTIQINAPISVTWNALTKPDLIKRWIWESDVTIQTDWVVGNPIVIRGDFHGIGFDNKGTVLEVITEERLTYTYWSTLSQIADEPNNYSIIEFQLKATEGQTTLLFTQRNFATRAIFKHFEFYWNTTLSLLKQLLESADFN